MIWLTGSWASMAIMAYAAALLPAGDQRYVRAGRERSVSDCERSVERAVKAAESRGGITLPATGAICAVRRELVGEVRSGEHRARRH